MPRRWTPVFLFALYATAGAFAIWVAHRLGQTPGLFQQGRLSLWQVFLAFLAVGVFFFVMIRKIRMRIFWEIIFGVAIYFGVWFICLILLPPVSATLLAAAVTVLPYVFPRVALHNLFMLIGACGVAVNFAPALSPASQIILLAGLTIYDMVVARPHGPLIHAVRELLRKRVVPGLLIPASWAGWWYRLDAPFESHAALLGAGDLILPLTLVSRVAFSSIPLAALVLVGTLSGLFVLVRERDAHPRAALPWLAAGTILPFFLLYLFGYFV